MASNVDTLVEAFASIAVVDSINKKPPRLEEVRNVLQVQQDRIRHCWVDRCSQRLPSRDLLVALFVRDICSNLVSVSHEDPSPAVDGLLGRLARVLVCQQHETACHVFLILKILQRRTSEWWDRAREDRNYWPTYKWSDRKSELAWNHGITDDTSADETIEASRFRVEPPRCSRRCCNPWTHGTSTHGTWPSNAGDHSALNTRQVLPAASIYEQCRASASVDIGHQPKLPQASPLNLFTNLTLSPGSTPSSAASSQPVLTMAFSMQPQQRDNPVQQILTKMRYPALHNNPGFIYCFSDPRAPTLLKIGFTKTWGLGGGDREYCQRIQRHRAMCGFEPKIHFVAEMECGAERIERLIHATLVSRGRTLENCRCGTRHREWFNVSVDEAKATTLLWMRFSDLRPWFKWGQLKPWWDEYASSFWYEHGGMSIREWIEGPWARILQNAEFATRENRFGTLPAHGASHEMWSHAAHRYLLRGV